MLGGPWRCRRCEWKTRLEIFDAQKVHAGAVPPALGFGFGRQRLVVDHASSLAPRVSRSARARSFPQSATSHHKHSYVGRVRFAVVIPVRNEAGGITATIDRVREAFAMPPLSPSLSARVPGPQSVDEGSLEIVVVDGGSRDRSVDRAQAAGAQVMRSEAGRAVQLDTGWRATQAETVVFLHADTRLPAGAGAAIAEALSAEDTVGGAFRFAFLEPSIGLRLVEWGAQWRHRLFNLPYGDQAIFARRRVLEAIGGVPQAEIMEDLDLVRALRAQGDFARLSLSVVTSARRYAANGVFRTWWRNGVALLAWHLGIERGRIAAWYRR